MAKNVVIVGLGRFGSVLSKELTQAGYDILGVDRRPDRVREMGQTISKAVQGEATDPELWRDIPVKGADAGVVAFSSSVEANVLAALLMRRAGLKHVVAVSRSELHSEVLQAIGVDQIVEPQVESAMRLARAFGTNIKDYLEVTKGFGIARIPAETHWKGATVQKVQQDEDVTVLALVRGHRVLLVPSENDKLSEGDVLVLAGKDGDLRKLPS
ncbi:MAG: TrkA family potassium uptake protein [SAR202 cluster bacterium]|nr:TrkA family potassium uptake protein [SAR202 cluster bacterium]